MDHPCSYYGLITTKKEKQLKLNVPLILEPGKQDPKIQKKYKKFII